MKGILCIFASLLFVCASNAQQTPSPAITAGDFIYVTAQLPIDTQTGRLVDGSIDSLTTLVLKNIKSILKTKGAKMNQVIQTTVSLADIRDYDAMTTAYNRFFDTATPPTTQVIQAANIPYNTSVQISCVAYTKRLSY